MSPLVAVLITIVLLALNALFVAAEFALLSTRRTQLEPLANAGSRSAKLALKAIENVNLAMAAAQLGITICSLGLGAISEPAFAHFLEPLFKAMSIPDAFVHPIAFVIALSFVVFLHVVYGEMVPKNIALASPARSSLILGPFMLGVVFLFKPLVVSLNAIANGVLRLVKIEPKDEVASTYSHDEVAGLVEESRREGLLDAEEYDLVTGALGFQGSTIADVLLPNDALVTIPADATPIDIEFACAETGYSRFPVRDEHGDFSGYLHIKDVLENDLERRSLVIADKWLRPLSTVAPDTGLYEALRVMQARGSHMARVADADGVVAGVVMLEDVLEELVGEVREQA